MKTELLSATTEGIARAAQELIQGQVCALPTETVYGLAGLAHSAESLARIFAAKERPHFDPLIVHVSPQLRTLSALDQARVTQSSRLSPRARERAESLMARFWPGPLTLVLPKHSSIPDLATSGLTTVGVRMPRHPIFQAVLEKVGAPLAAPSANRFGRISPTEASHALNELEGRIPLVLDGGACEVGVESTIVAVDTDGTLEWLRPGEIGRAEIQEALGLVPSEIRDPKPSHTPHAPGMLESHYAPRTPLIRLECAWEERSPLHHRELERQLDGKPWALLHWGEPPEDFGSLTRPLLSISLSRGYDASQAAQNLFGALRALDQSGAHWIVASGFPLSQPQLSIHSLFAAITDRLERASSERLRDPLCDAARAAILEAWKYVGATAPNPPVGAAVLDQGGRILTVAAHPRAGALHAEALAFRELRLSGKMEAARTLVVTLEPCHHHGKTGPCTAAIAETPIRDVVYALSDPNPQAQGGPKWLGEKGIRCRPWSEAGLPPFLTLTAQRLSAPFSKWIQTGLPWVVLKSAINPQGTMIPPPGRKTFTSPSSLLLAHRLRRESDAILTGSGTIITDVPELTVRRLADHTHALLKAKPRKLVILDRRKRVSEVYRRLAADKGFEVLWITDPVASQIPDLLRSLGKQGVMQILVEAGPTLRDVFLREGLWDRHVIMHSQEGQSGGSDRIEDVYRNH